MLRFCEKSTALPISGKKHEKFVWVLRLIETCMHLMGRFSLSNARTTPQKSRKLLLPPREQLVSSFGFQLDISAFSSSVSSSMHWLPQLRTLSIASIESILKGPPLETNSYEVLVGLEGCPADTLHSSITPILKSMDFSVCLLTIQHSKFNHSCASKCYNTVLSFFRSVHNTQVPGFWPKWGGSVLGSNPALLAPQPLSLLTVPLSLENQCFFRLSTEWNVKRFVFYINVRDSTEFLYSCYQ